MHKFLLIFIVLFAFLSCEKSDVNLKIKTHYLTSDIWVMKSYIDYETNISYEIPKADYKFEKDGTFIIFPNVDSIPRYSKWEFDEEMKYLTIGSNKYKLESLSNKLLGLNYGTIRIYYTKKDS